MRLIYSTQVAKDLRDLRRYSEEQWGRSRTALYLEEIYNTIHRLAKRELHGRPADDLQHGLLKALTGRHHIYFSMQRDALHVFRIVHGSMNVEKSFFSSKMQ